MKRTLISISLFTFVLFCACHPRVQTTTPRWNVTHLVRVDKTLLVNFVIDPSIDYKVDGVRDWVNFAREQGLIFHDDTGTVDISVELATPDKDDLCFTRNHEDGSRSTRCTTGVGINMSPEIPIPR